jgi:hypothetical protein
MRFLVCQMMKTDSLLRNLTWASIGILISGVFLSFEVLASSIGVSLDELIEKSDLVISGTVIGMSSYREPSFLMDIESSDRKGNDITRVESSSQILTDFEIEVSNVISGSYDKSIIHLTVMGGTVGSKSISYSHSFGLITGKEYILFLGYEKRNDKWWTVAGRQGVFEEVVVGSKVFRTVYGERLTIEQFQSRIKASTHE